MTIETRRVLKARSARNIGTESTFNYEDIRERCDAYIKDAEEQARAVLEKAHADAEQIRKNAFQEAKEAGRNEGMADAENEIQRRSVEIAQQLATEKLDTALPAMRAAADALTLERDHWLSEWQRSAVHLSIAIAEKIVRHQIDLKPEIGNNIIQEALQLAAGSPQISLHLNPIDVERIGDETQASISQVTGNHQLEIVPDESITLGGCLIKTQHGIVDAQLETQLERVAAELLE